MRPMWTRTSQRSVNTANLFNRERHEKAVCKKKKQKTLTQKNSWTTVVFSPRVTRREGRENSGRGANAGRVASTGRGASTG